LKVFCKTTTAFLCFLPKLKWRSNEKKLQHSGCSFSEGGKED